MVTFSYHVFTFFSDSEPKEFLRNKNYREKIKETNKKVA